MKVVCIKNGGISIIYNLTINKVYDAEFVHSADLLVGYYRQDILY